MPFIPHNQDDIRQMLETIGVGTISELFGEIPNDLRCGELTKIAEGLSEGEIARKMQKRAKNDRQSLCFAGAGAYDHYIPAVVWELAMRGEFYSAYTPYQAEASQGTLQVLYEYQSMMAALTDMDASNSSLYDGASALAEAVLMAIRANRKSKSKRILMPASVSPLYRNVVTTIVGRQGIKLETLPYDPTEGCTVPDDLQKFKGHDIAALVIAQPNFFGVLEEVDALTQWAHENGILVIAVVNPISLAVLKPPGQWGDSGADIVCGEGQPLGIPLSSGGPYFGFMTCRKAVIRQMPGRIVGRTMDRNGKIGYTLTLQAREQHIRRAKATSNICTNQGLMVTAATIYMALLGAEGLQQVALTALANRQMLVQRLTAIDGITQMFSGSHFHEVALRFENELAELLLALSAQDIVGGYPLTQGYPELGNALLICTTDAQNEEDIDVYCQHIESAMQRSPTCQRQQS